MKNKIKSALGHIKADLVIKNANVLNVFTEEFEKTDIAIADGIITGVGSYSGINEIDASGKAVVPSFIDGHMHLESSVISPFQYARAIMPHGTSAVVADPHEITNVSGKAGFYYMVEEAKNLPLDIYFTVPSCVPATPFDHSGAEINDADIRELMALDNVLGLAEMMNYPGVLSCVPEVLDKLSAAEETGKIIDGHAPSLSGKSLNAYALSGARSDHECTAPDEAMEKIRRGQWIMVREGTASKNLEALLPLFNSPYCNRCMLCTDDKHPTELAEEGHLDHIIRKAISLGAPVINAYKMASYNASLYFGLKNRGAIAPGYMADFVILEDIAAVKIHSVYKNGKLVDAAALIPSERKNPYDKQVQNTVNIGEITPESFALKKEKEKVIGLVPQQILTTDEGYSSKIDLSCDICKLSVVERHRKTGNIGTAFVKGYGLKAGAIATSVAHDSHNIIVAGTNDSDMAFAVKEIEKMQGGMVIVKDGELLSSLALPIAGLMCGLDAKACGEKLSELKETAYALGVHHSIDPFMTLSFSSLAVIPALRLTTLGVVDVNKFELI